MLSYVLLIVGFVLLVKGADYFVEGCSSVAKILKVPSIIIGLTIVAFGTSAPEAAVSITAALTGNNDIAIGNVIGSNIFNLLVVVGVCGLILPMGIDKGILKKEFPFSILVAAVLLAMIGFDHQVGRIDGLILLVLFACFLAWMIHSALTGREEASEEYKVLTPLRSAVYIICGLAAVVLGGDCVVKSASSIAESFGLSQNLIALTIVALGTSLPELVTSIVASRKGENGLALGNVVGSNIFNILLILGASSAISPVAVGFESVIDLSVLIVFSLITWVMARGKYKIGRVDGGLMLAMYLGYMVYIILR